MRVLFLSRWFPEPPNNGSKIRILNLLKGLTRDHQVTLISFFDPNEGEPDLSAFQVPCEDVQLVPWREFQPGSKRSLIGFFQSTPRFFADTFSGAMQEAIEQALKHSRFDRVVASQIDMAAYAESFKGISALFEEAEVGFLYDQYQKSANGLERFRYGLTWEKHRRYVLRLLKYFKQCTVVSEQERQLLIKAISPDIKVDVVPNCVDVERYQGRYDPPLPNRIIFTGSMTFAPNYEGAQWFIHEVYPQIRENIPGACLAITGDHAGLKLPNADGVTLTGYVEDVRPLIAGSTCSVVPILQGGGTRLKILEAMALGAPVVATSKGAEGLDVQDGVHLLVADQPASFATAVTRILKEPELHRHLAQNARELVKNRYDWKSVLPDFLNILENIG